jgi:hypothetical protein
LVGDFTGLPIVKVYRYDFPKPEIPSKYSGYISEDGEIDEQKFIGKFGLEEFHQAISFLHAMSIVSSYWLCQDCILIEDRDEFCGKCEYFFERWKQKSKM